MPLPVAPKNSSRSDFEGDSSWFEHFLTVCWSSHGNNRSRHGSSEGGGALVWAPTPGTEFHRSRYIIQQHSSTSSSLGPLPWEKSCIRRCGGVLILMRMSEILGVAGTDDGDGPRPTVSYVRTVLYDHSASQQSWPSG